MAEAPTISVEVAYALPQRQEIVALEVAPGTTALQAMECCDITKKFPEIELAGVKLGIFGKAIKPQQKLHGGDRVEIYRPLLLDLKEVRRLRAAKAKQRRAALKAG